ncbi:unnamed protein product [Malus baccata var. baccata]
MNDEETQGIIQARNQGKKKDFKIRETNGMPMQESRMYVPNNMELKKAILDEAHILAYAMHSRASQSKKKEAFWIDAATSRSTMEMGKYYYGFCVQASSTTYHPQTDGQSERTMQTLEDMLRSSVLHFGDAWHKRLDLMEFAYNNSFHSSIGNWVFLNLSPWKGVVRFGKKGKLSPRYIGPYMITERVGEVAYRLDLPPELSKVHNVFHVFMLHYYVSDPSQVIPPQPMEINSNLTYDVEPVTILDWKD